MAFERVVGVAVLLIALAALAWCTYRLSALGDTCAGQRPQKRHRGASPPRPPAPSAPAAGAGFLFGGMHKWKSVQDMIRLKNEMSTMDDLIGRLTPAPG